MQVNPLIFNNILASTEKILIILKWIWSSELKSYCKKLAKQQPEVNKIHVLINYIILQPKCKNNILKSLIVMDKYRYQFGDTPNQAFQQSPI